MLQLVPFLWRRIEFASVPCIAVSFWALAVLVHIKLQGSVIKPLVLGALLLCCLLLLGFVNLRWWKSLGTPGWFLLASIASYLFISSGTSLATDAELSTKDVARQGFFFLVTLAAILGGRWLLERIGAERLLKWTLVILMASCAVVLASPWLRDMGVLPEYRHPYRMTGTFTDPNDAGFIACMTAVLALAFQSNGRQRLPWVSGSGPGMRRGTRIVFLYSDSCSGRDADPVPAAERPPPETRPLAHRPDCSVHGRCPGLAHSGGAGREYPPSLD